MKNSYVDYLVEYFGPVDDYDAFVELGEIGFWATRRCPLLHVLYHIGSENLAGELYGYHRGYYLDSYDPCDRYITSMVEGVFNQYDISLDLY